MTSRLRETTVVIVAALAAWMAGCKTLPVDPDGPSVDLPDVPDPSETGGTTSDLPFPEPATCPAAPACDAGIAVKADGPALMITDPAVLAAFPLEKVISQLTAYEGVVVAPEVMLQRLFDTMNTTEGGKFDDVFHCDSLDGPAAQNQTADPFTCPRAEGKLASSTGFFKPGDPDSFFPVAIVNRFDLTPVDGSRCGQYRIIYAKTSGLTDPNNRVFMIFEAALQNPLPGCLETCRPIAQLWQGLEGKSTEAITSELETFFFDGLPGYRAVIHPENYGLGIQAQGYGGAEPGQIRLSMHMEDSWDMREVHFDLQSASGQPLFLQNSVKNNPSVALFDSQSAAASTGEWYRQQFMWQELPALSGKDLTHVQMFTNPQFNGNESMLSGDKKNDYFAAATKSGDMTFVDELNAQIQATGFGADCPADDPLDAEAILHRATVLSCAGCHAPKELIGESRSLGCGLTWPDSIGQSHVTEKGERSPALKDVFLPHRADVLATFLQACDWQKIGENLQPSPQGQGGDKKVKSADGAVRTLGGSASH